MHAVSEPIRSSSCAHSHWQPGQLNSKTLKKSFSAVFKGKPIGLESGYVQVERPYSEYKKLQAVKSFLGIWVGADGEVEEQAGKRSGPCSIVNARFEGCAPRAQHAALPADPGTLTAIGLGLAQGEARQIKACPVEPLLQWAAWRVTQGQMAERRCISRS